MPDIDKINGIDEDDISHHNGGAADLYTSKNGDTWVHATYMAATGGTVTTDGDYKVHTFTGTAAFIVRAVGSAGTGMMILQTDNSGTELQSDMLGQNMMNWIIG